jgi:hypothetical protein
MEVFFPKYIAYLFISGHDPLPSWQRIFKKTFERIIFTKKVLEAGQQKIIENI